MGFGRLLSRSSADPIRYSQCDGQHHALQRKVFDKVGGFNGALGRAGGSLISCEETEFCLRASAAFPSGRFVFDPDGKLLHKVPRGRRSLRYFVRRCYAEGRSKAILADLVSQHDALKTERDYALRL